MLVENQIIKLAWSTSNRKRYEEKGYKFTHYRDIVVVKAEDLSRTSKSRVKVECDYCGVIYSTTFASYYDGKEKFHKSACPKCAGKKASEINKGKRAEERYKTVVEICIKNDYVLLSKAEDFKHFRSARVKYICPKHGEKTTSLDSFIRGHSCSNCGRELASKRLRKEIEDVEKEMLDKHGNMLLNKEEYVDANTVNLKVKCKKCEKVFMTSFSIYKRLKCGCPYCGRQISHNSKRFSPNDVEDIINSVNNNVLLNKEDYCKNNVLNLKIKCGKCNNIYITSLTNYQYGKISCNKCSSKESRHEKEIRELLESNNIAFEQQKRFLECTDKRQLPFDFYLPNYNLCIEYDGEFHYLKRSHDWKTKNPDESLFYVQRHDQIKDEFCQNHGIELLRIPYWEKDNLKEIILNKLKSCSPINE